MSLPFEKYSACGNDFILVDNRFSNFLEHLSPKRIAHLCNRRLGIGADGMVFLNSSQSADFRMRIFNADGSEAEMCGNGVRCLARFIKSKGIDKDYLSIETMLQQVHVRTAGDQVSVDMPSPTDVQYAISLEIEKKKLTLHYLDTGVPHAVWFVEDLEDAKQFSLAPTIRFHPRFPKGANVDLACIQSDRDIAVRTYERGVEQETLACGTGAVAVAIAAAQNYHLRSPLNIHTRSGEVIRISFDAQAGVPSGIVMTGPAKKIYSGEVLTNFN